VNIFTAIAEAIAAVGAAVAAIGAVIGVNSWRHQLRANVDFEAARRALLAALKVRHAIRAFRNPFHSIQEIAATGAESFSNYERELYTRRWKSVVEAGEELRAVELEGEVLWGRDFAAQLKVLTDCVRDLSFAIDDYLRRKEGAPGTDPDSRYLTEAEAIVKKKVGKQALDEFETKVFAAVEALEAFLRPKLAAGRRAKKSEHRT
jgi:hypothetical protein